MGWIALEVPLSRSTDDRGRWLKAGLKASHPYTIQEIVTQYFFYISCSKYTINITKLFRYVSNYITTRYVAKDHTGWVLLLGYFSFRSVFNMTKKVICSNASQWCGKVLITLESHHISLPWALIWCNLCLHSMCDTLFWNHLFFNFELFCNWSCMKQKRKCYFSYYVLPYHEFWKCNLKAPVRANKIILV